MSFGLGISFGRVCRQRMTIQQIVEGFDFPGKRKISPKKCVVKLGDKEIWVREHPQEPSKIVKRNGWTYYIDEHNHCYGMVRDNWDKE